MRRWLWLHLTPAGRFERAAAKRYESMLERGREAARERAAKRRECSPHPNRVRLPNPPEWALKT